MCVRKVGNITGKDLFPRKMMDDVQALLSFIFSVFLWHNNPAWFLSVILFFKQPRQETALFSFDCGGVCVVKGKRISGFWCCLIG